jgi:hypothetical protein
MQTNPFLKKSKFYIKSLVFFVAITLTIMILALLLLLSLVDIVFLKDSAIKFIFALLGFLLPIEKGAYEKLKDSSPWETYLNYLIKKEKLSSESKIRISYAAVVVVELNGKYLLLQNSKGIELFHFPSWTYGISEEESKRIEIKFGALKDSFIKKDYNDYRFLVPVKNLKKFYEDFCEKVNPYNYSCAAIIEDFTKKCLLDTTVFSNTKSLFKWRKIEKIKYSRYTRNYEMNIRDIYVLCLNEEERNELQKTQNVTSSTFKWATQKEIEANGINEECNKLYADIAPFTYEIMTENIEGWVTIKNCKL